MGEDVVGEVVGEGVWGLDGAFVGAPVGALVGCLAGDCDGGSVAGGAFETHVFCFPDPVHVYPSQHLTLPWHDSS